MNIFAIQIPFPMKYMLSAPTTQYATPLLSILSKSIVMPNIHFSRTLFARAGDVTQETRIYPHYVRLQRVVVSLVWSVDRPSVDPVGDRHLDNW